MAQSFDVRAKEIYKSNPLILPITTSKYELFTLLYTTYCSRSHNADSFEKVSKDNSFDKACNDLFSWYKERYIVRFQMPVGQRGQQRNVTFQETFCEKSLDDTYRFDVAYPDNRAFKKYLIPTETVNYNQDFFAFILHTAVAFMVDPVQLDDILRSYGFHPLHVRNIHHLAIYTVLVECAQFGSDIPDSYNPFDKVREMYGNARKILNTSEIGTEEQHCTDASTATMRKDLIDSKNLTEKNFLSIVENDKRAFSMRHSLILEDHHKFAVLFSGIYDNYQLYQYRKKHGDQRKNAYFSRWSEDAQYYSLYSFLTRHSKHYDRHARFTGEIFTQVDEKQKHPTRELMILFWFFSYCFAFTKGVFMPQESFDAIAESLGEFNPAWKDEALGYYRNSYFDVYGFVYNIPTRCIGTSFTGANFIAEINSKLSEKYGWGQLSEKLSFDYYILQLKKLKMTIYDSDLYRKSPDVFFNHIQYSNFSFRKAEAECVPYPWVVFDEIMTYVRACSPDPTEYYPLSCAIYEQI